VLKFGVRTLVVLVWLWCVPVAFGRGFELVSPQVKGADVQPDGTARAAADGHGVAYISSGSLDPAAASRGIISEFLSRRASAGWATVGMNPPLDPGGIGISQLFEGLAADLSAGVGMSWGSEVFGHPQMKNLWRLRSSDGSLALVSDPAVPVAPEAPPLGVTGGNHFAGGSAAFGHIVFDSAKALVSGVTSDECRLQGCLYEWVDGLGVRLVSYLPADEGGGLLLSASLGYASPYASASGAYPGDFAVSEDGRRVFFSASVGGGAPATRVFVRENGVVSRGVSVSERTDCAEDPLCGGDGVGNLLPDPGMPGAQFQGANRDGSQAVFAASAQLTDNATASGSGGIGGPAGRSGTCADGRCDLYLWDSSGDVGHRLTDLTTDDGAGGGVLATVGQSEDLSRVYFVAVGVLGSSDAVEGKPNLYVWERDQGVRLVATLDATLDGGLLGDEGVWARDINNTEFQNHGFRGARVSSDGRFLVFRSRARVTGFDNAGTYQVYRYDAVDGSLVCVSCNGRVGVSGGDAFLKRWVVGFLAPWLSRNVSSDGSRVFFDSEEALVAGDTNGRIDTYEWVADGSVRLVSSGLDRDNTNFVDASESGDDVFFITRARLVRSDKDDLADMYDARVGPVFSDPDEPLGCGGDECQGAPTPPPTLAGPGTAAVTGRGTSPPKSLPKARKRAVRCRRGAVRRRVSGRVRCVKKHPKKAKKAGGSVRVLGGRGR
jgi:hypothetical protein